jgi:hypothetical protein
VPFLRSPKPRLAWEDCGFWRWEEEASVHFYPDALGMEMLYGGEDSEFSSLRARDAESAILNLEAGEPVTRRGRLIFNVADRPSSRSRRKRANPTRMKPDTAQAEKASAKAVSLSGNGKS